MTGNIMGEDFDKWVIQQIQDRQKAHGKGYNNTNRNPQILNYLSNRNSWVKMASPVSIDGDNKTINLILEDIGLTPIENYKGIKLAQQAVLFNTLTDYSNTPNSPRKGITSNKSIWNNFSYGLGSTKFGINPSPGIISAEITSLNNGSIRSAVVKLKAYNKFQFDLIEMLYMKLGFSLMLEWGWDSYVTSDANGDLIVEHMGNTLIDDEWFNLQGTTQLEMINKIRSLRETYKGNYDAFFGRVKNFNWEFDDNGNYNIDLELITIGSLVESLNIKRPTSSDNFGLKLNTTPTTKKNISECQTYEEIINFVNSRSKGDNESLDDKPLFSLKERQSNVVLDWLYSYKFILDTATPEKNDISPDFYVIPKDTVQTFTNKVNRRTPTYNQRLSKTPPRNSKYFIRLGTLLEKIQGLCIPLIENGNKEAPILEIDTNTETNLMYVRKDQISFDPTICLHSPKYFFRGEKNLKLENIAYQYGSEGLFGDLNLMKDFLFKTTTSYGKKEVLNSGKLMNLYINFNFIKDTFAKATNDENEVPLYKFLKYLCEGINNSFSNLTQLEPVIKDDYTIILLDQNLSPEVLEKVKKPLLLEVYGYNPDNNQSNFLKSIKFTSKLTPQLASQISISATAENISTENVKVDLFKLFTEGLQDRFSQKTKYKPSSNTLIDGVKIDKIRRLGAIWDAVEDKKYADSVFNNIQRSKFKPGVANYNLDELEVLKTIKYGQRVYKDVNKEEFIRRGLYYDSLYQQKAAEYNEKLPLLEYREWVLQCLGGYISEKFWSTSNNLENNIVYYYKDSQYFNMDRGFQERGKLLYKNYLDYLSKKSGNPSKENRLGFIPLHFSITLEGISGIKILNGLLEIGNNFLPFQYPKIFKFLIQGVNHKIENNNWETNLNTLSTSNLSNLNRYEEFSNIESDEEETKPTIPEITNNLENCKDIYSNKVYQDIIKNTPTLSGIGDLSRDDIAMLMFFISRKESQGGGDTKARNSRGYVGRYQFGLPALHDLGYITDNANADLRRDSNPKGKLQRDLLPLKSTWSGKDGINSQEDFLNSPNIQNKVMINYIRQNYRTLQRIKTILPTRTPKIEQSGLLAISHLLGAGNARKYALGEDIKGDGNGTTAQTYFEEGVKSYSQSQECPIP
jgi:hypothetical protein